jgi:hypothetical protein
LPRLRKRDRRGKDEGEPGGNQMRDLPRENGTIKKEMTWISAAL